MSESESVLEKEQISRKRRFMRAEESLFEHVIKVKQSTADTGTAMPTINLPEQSKMIYVDEPEQYIMDLPANGTATVDSQLLAPPAPTHARGRQQHVQLVTETGAGGYLTRDQLAKYTVGSAKGWRCLRLALFLLFWVLLIGLLVATALLVYYDPKRTTGAQWGRAWWKRGVFYRVNVKSYQDSNSDGVGDLNGLISRLDYIAQLGVTSLLLGPLFHSSSGNSFAVQDWRETDSAVGSSEDFDQLVSEVHARNMTLVMDMLVSRTGSDHDWFRAESNRPRGDAGYYVWQDGMWGGQAGVSAVSGVQIPGPPNAMATRSSERGPGHPAESAWKWSDGRQQYFLQHSYAGVPDLDYSNPAVKGLMDETMRFWLARGVDGLRLLDIQDMVFSASVQREYMQQAPGQRRRLASEALDVVRHWRRVMDDPLINPSRMHKLLMVRGQNLQEDAAHLVNAGVNLVMDDNLLKVDSTSTGNDIADIADAALKNVPIGRPDTVAWALTDYDQNRVMSRMGSLDLIDGMHMACLLLPGTCVTFYGDELGLLDGPGEKSRHRQDPYFLIGGPQLTPMPWTTEPLGGFTNHSIPWLATLDTRKNFHQTVQLQQRVDTSHLANFRRLVGLRQHEAARTGSYHRGVVSPDIFSFMRQAADGSGLLVAVDLRKTGSAVQEYTLLPGGIQLPPSGTSAAGSALYYADVALGSQAVFKRSDPNAQLGATNATVNLYASLLLRPAEAVVLTFPSLWASNGMAKRGLPISSTTTTSKP